MILSEQNRTAATDKFNGLSATVKKLIVNASVMLKSKDNKFFASGAIFYQSYSRTGNNSPMAYVVTAKHNLYVYAGQSAPPENPPSQYASQFRQNVEIYYGANALGDTPATRAAIWDVILFPDKPDDWTTDIVMLASQDGGLFNYIKANGYLPDINAGYRNNAALRYRQGGNGASALDRRRVQLVQTGFGNTRDSDLVNTRNWANNPKKLQCRFPLSDGTQPTATIYNVPPNTQKVNWNGCPTLENQLMLNSCNNNSTAPGDSGGPLFSTATGGNGTTIDLVGMTSGANFMADIATPDRAPVDSVIESNCSAYVDMLIAQEMGYLPGG